MLDIVHRERVTIVKLPAFERKELLLRRNRYNVLDIGLYRVNGMIGVDFKRDSLAICGFDMDLH